MSKVKEALTRADEAGGDLRDRLVERYRESERAQKLVGRIARLRGAKHEVEIRRPADKPVVEASADEATAVVVERKGHGDPGVAAQIFGRSSCPWTGRAITLFENHKIDYDFVDMDDEDNAALDTPLVAETKQNTVPYVYLRGKFIGGFNALAEVERLGQLEFAVMDAEERAANPAAKKIEIIPRPNTDESAPGES